MDDEWPGLWRLWLKHQCATVGYPPPDCRMEGGWTNPDWIRARNALNKIEPGDFIVAALPDRRIGRLGEVVHNKTAGDEWDPLIYPYPDKHDGQMGRRILVRWDLANGPDDPDLVAKLPEGFAALGRGTVNQVRSKSAFKLLREVMADPANWVGLVGRFGYEKALSDYIALYPHKLEDGLVPYPNEKLREIVFKNRSRADVLLRDKDEKPVIVECKQESPTIKNIRQLRGYMKRLNKKTGKVARGILVHGGAKKVHKEVWREAGAKSPRIEIFQYKLDVDFARSTD